MEIILAVPASVVEIFGTWQTEILSQRIILCTVLYHQK